VSETRWKDPVDYNCPGKRSRHQRSLGKALTGKQEFGVNNQHRTWALWRISPAPFREASLSAAGSVVWKEAVLKYLDR